MKRYRGLRCAFLLALASVSVVGCGGVRGSHSVSPASLFLPGLIKNDTPRPAGTPLPPPQARHSSAPTTLAT